jgi:hypothetical protein
VVAHVLFQVSLRVALPSISKPQALPGKQVYVRAHGLGIEPGAVASFK